MKIWCVDYSGLSHNVYSALFFTKEEAELQMDALPKTGCYKKMYQVEDIWRWCARNFQEVLAVIIASRDDGDDKIYIYNMCNEIKEAALHCGVLQCSVDGFWTDEQSFVLSVAWCYDGKLNHRTWHFDARDDFYEYPTIVERRSKWTNKVEVGDCE